MSGSKAERPDHSGRSAAQQESLDQRRRAKNPCPAIRTGELGGDEYIWTCDRPVHLKGNHHDPNMGDWSAFEGTSLTPGEAIAIGIAEEALNLISTLDQTPGNRILVLQRAHELRRQLDGIRLE